VLLALCAVQVVDHDLLVLWILEGHPAAAAAAAVRRLAPGLLDLGKISDAGVVSTSALLQHQQCQCFMVAKAIVLQSAEWHWRTNC
jgi:hypothetical protein